MGLDNGIVCRLRPGYHFGPMAGRTFRDTDIEGAHVCYWRKCWNVRNDIFCLIETKRDSLGGEYDLTYSDVVSIRKLIFSYLRRSNWDENNSIWTHAEIRPHIFRGWLALGILLYYMRRGAVERVYFYDSF